MSANNKNIIKTIVVFCLVFCINSALTGSILTGQDKKFGFNFDSSLSTGPKTLSLRDQLRKQLLNSFSTSTTNSDLKASANQNSTESIPFSSNANNVNLINKQNQSKSSSQQIISSQSTKVSSSGSSNTNISQIVVQSKNSGTKTISSQIPKPIVLDTGSINNSVTTSVIQSNISTITPPVKINQNENNNISHISNSTSTSSNKVIQNTGLPSLINTSANSSTKPQPSPSDKSNSTATIQNTNNLNNETKTSSNIVQNSSSDSSISIPLQSSSSTLTNISTSSISNSTSTNSINTIQSTIINSGNYYENSNAVINQANAQSQQVSQYQYQSVDSIFSRLPSPADLRELILTADSYPLIKTIQQVSDSNLTCQQKISYLSDFLGRMQTAVVMKNVTLQKLGIIITSAQTQIKRLTQQIQKKTDSISFLSIDVATKKLNDNLDLLKTAYQNFNNAEALVQPKNTDILTSQAKIENYKKRSDSARQQIPTKQIQLVNINTKISQLQQQLNDAKSQKSAVQAYLSNLNSTIDNNQKLLKVQQIVLSQLQAQLIRLQDQSDRTKTRYKTLQVQTQRMRAQLADKYNKSGEITAAINDLQAKIANEKKKADVNVQSKLQDYIKILAGIVPTVQQKINELNFKCNQVKDLQTMSLRSTSAILYMVNPRDLVSYLQSSYNISQSPANTKILRTSFMCSSILDQAWKNALGAPFIADSVPQNDAANNTTFIFKEDFNCLSTTQLESGSGIVVSINKKSIQVKTSNNVVYILNLSACSRLEVTQQIPQIGQNIFFRGNKINDIEYNVYKVSCF